MKQLLGKSARLAHLADIEGNPLSLGDVKRLIKQAPGKIHDTEREVLIYNQALEWARD